VRIRAPVRAKLQTLAGRRAAGERLAFIPRGSMLEHPRTGQGKRPTEWRPSSRGSSTTSRRGSRRARGLWSPSTCNGNANQPVGDSPAARDGGTEERDRSAECHAEGA
jgi:hypothetical protein